MSFSARVKEDMTRIELEKECCKKAEFAAFLRMCGTINIGFGQQVSLNMNTENSQVARRFFTLAKSFFPERQLMVHRKNQLRKNRVYSLLIPPQPALTELLGGGAGLLWRGDPFANLLPDISNRECCRRAYLRGAMLAAGSISEPEKGYHLEIVCSNRYQADTIIELMHSFDLQAKSVRRKETQVVYLNNAEQISNFLIIAGSHRSLLEMENTRVEKEIRNNVNRLVNCDKANLNKTISAALRQKDQIEYVLEQIGFEVLPKTLREAAELRLEYPETSLSDLAEISGLGRSALNHRLRRLAEIADNIETYGKAEWNR